MSCDTTEPKILFKSLWKNLNNFFQNLSGLFNDDEQLYLINNDEEIFKTDDD